MREKLEGLGETIFSIFIIIAIGGGGIIFLMFLIAIILGGETGNAMALLAKDTIMPIFIRLGAIAMAGGLLKLYAADKHELILDDNE
ncbi:MAG: hypothetical protein GX231_04890 [Tissierellia bacterium]|jgi:hypothetical protein|nr:hypothetical protein [Tissierellia bacterium]